MRISKREGRESERTSKLMLNSIFAALSAHQFNGQNISPAPCMVTRKYAAGTSANCLSAKHGRFSGDEEISTQWGGTWLEKHWTFTCVYQPNRYLSWVDWLTHKSGFWVLRLILLKSLTLTSATSKSSMLGLKSSLSNKMQIFIFLNEEIIWYAHSGNISNFIVSVLSLSSFLCSLPLLFFSLTVGHLSIGRSFSLLWLSSILALCSSHVCFKYFNIHLFFESNTKTGLRPKNVVIFLTTADTHSFKYQ